MAYLKKLGHGFDDKGNWNTAGIYALESVYNNTKEILESFTVAKFGTSSLIEDFMIEDSIKIKARIMSFERILGLMQTLYTASHMLIWREDYQIRFKKLNDQIEKLEEDRIINSMRTIKVIDGVTKIKINDLIFNKILKYIEVIFREYLEILNRHNLIMTSIEEFDVDEWKASLIEQMITKP